MGKRFGKCEYCGDCYERKDEQLHRLTCKSNKNALSAENAKTHIQQRKKVKRVVSSVPENSGSVSTQCDHPLRINNTGQLVQ